MRFRALAWCVVVCLATAICAIGSDSSRAAQRKPASSLASKGAKKAAVAAGRDDFSEDQVDGIISASVDDLWAKTDYYWHRGDYPRIIALDRIIVELDPHFMEPYSVGGWLMESDGDNASAEAFYKLGVANNQDSSYMYYYLAAFYFNTLKNYAAAAKVSSEAVAKTDADINDWRMLAHAYEKNRQLNDALHTWKTIKQKWPDGAAVDLNLARVQRLVDAANASVSGSAGDAAPASAASGASAPSNGSSGKAPHPANDNPVISF